ncbi:MAG TPA: glutamine synthetase [Candidatus Competibacteraceae bacterium]|nr:glutamine synthetase [Candidatus Competibacteraceae bacterium]
MVPRQVKTVADAQQIVEERGLSHVKVGVFDVDGILRGKYLSREKFIAALESGFGFCSVVLGWDSKDQLYDNVAYTGWHTGYHDSQVRIIPESCRELPFENSLFFLCEFDGDAAALCPRNVLKRVLAKAEAMGYTPFAAFEYEFFAFQENPHSVREKHYRNLKPLTPDYFGYSVLRNSVWAEFYHELLALGRDMDFPLEGLHTETGAGVLEAAITVDEGIAAADKAALFKTFSKVVAQRRDLMLSFMAKWSMDWPGCGGHLHLSLKDADGQPVFYDESAPQRLSRTMRHFIAGQQRLMPEFLALVAPTVNSFSRLIPGYWAPTNATWGAENRTCALRVIGGSPKSQRVEYRVAAADGNPYLVLAAALASGLWGIEHKLEPLPAMQGNAYAQQPPAEFDLPRTLMEAAQRLRRSEAARAAFGDAFIEHYAATREWEEREFRRHVTDWELNRYFEII